MILRTNIVLYYNIGFFHKMISAVLEMFGVFFCNKGFTNISYENKKSIFLEKKNGINNKKFFIIFMYKIKKLLAYYNFLI